MDAQKNVLVLGNGFDLYHFLPTRYVDFLHVANRLAELKAEGSLARCQYINYVLGPASPIYIQDAYIQKCYEVYTQKMKSVKLDQGKIEELAAIAEANTWIQYFQACLEKDIGWIDFEKEIGQVLSAVQKLFSLDSRADELVSGVPLIEPARLGKNTSDKLAELDLKTIDILKQLPFVSKSSFIFQLKKEYCVKGIGDEHYIAIDKEAILGHLEEELVKLAKALCIYLKEFVQKIAIDKRADNPVFYQIDKVLTFNYTDTYARLYDAAAEINYIHGCINDEARGIVLGINNDSRDELEEMDTGLIRFKKYYQRAMKDTFYSVEDFLDHEQASYKVSIVGHSIDVTDRDILVGLMKHERTEVTIYYHDEKAHGQQVVNLISLVGKEEFDRLRNAKKLMFKQLPEFREAPAGAAAMEGMEEEDFPEYKIRRKYKFLEDDCGSFHTLLIGNEIVQVSARDGEAGIAEVTLVDYFLNLQEFYNHSGRYKGAVRLVELFNDNRYCGAGAYVEYIKAKDEDTEHLDEIRALFATDCDGIGIEISEIKVVESGGEAA
ncbi:MAG TPA: bacteriophage abortive infection AbiH family protein [Candidatus Egerieimonas intestinavium]|uniref:Bacteriophage abortive infection AbiH family protein n=1 Tax=Candidatus Egerieimonas intestinavium TaxID=2840777 RepID=A0A9D1EMI5_9FIRM|nr:bacteriophage abortive infection AbiH family protein [Candidatus Egerieimonas intestinavium]